MVQDKNPTALGLSLVFSFISRICINPNVFLLLKGHKDRFQCQFWALVQPNFLSMYLLTCLLHMMDAYLWDFLIMYFTYYSL